MIVAEVIFWSSLSVCVYIYFGYPALLGIISRFRSRPVKEADVFPRVTFIIPAYNEEQNIASKIENTLGLDYPRDALEVIVASNGSTDRTNEIVRGYAGHGVRLLAIEEPGKINALNEAALAATGDILVFTDADFLLDAEALRLMSRKFADPAVGGVCGARKTSVRREGDATGEGEGMYARWDKWQKIQESRIGSVFAADGLLYAIRKDLYVPITDPAQSDDMAISMRVVLQGYRLLYEPGATAWENAAVTAREEFRRKIRITNHSVSALLKLGWPLIASGFYSLELLSHKLVRHFIAWFLIALFISSIILAPTRALYLAALAGQLAIYALAITGAMLREHSIGRSRLLTVPYYFCFVNAAAFVGTLSILRGEKKSAWSTRSLAAEPPHGSPQSVAQRDRLR